MSKVRDEIIEILAHHARLDPEKVDPKATLRDLEITSLEVIEIAFEIEERFGVTLPDRDPAYASNRVGELVDALERMVTTLRFGGPAQATP